MYGKQFWLNPICDAALPAFAVLNEQANPTAKVANSQAGFANAAR